MSVLKFFPKFIYSQWFFTPPYPTERFDGQTVIVTGANIGLGLEAAKHIARLGATKLIIAVRSIEKGERAKKEIEEQTKCKEGTCEVWHLDLSSHESVREFAKQIDLLERVDVVLENAGMGTREFRFVEGNEMTINTNVISTFLLALLVLPKLKQTAARFNTKSRLVIVSSEVHFITTMPERKNARIFDALNDKAKARMWDRYNVSKLLEVLVVREVVTKYMSTPDYPIIVNYVNPGLCHSAVMREPGFLHHAWKVWKFLMHARTTEVGGRTLTHAASAGQETHGQYLSDCTVKPPARFVTKEEGKRTQQRVWEELSEKLEKIHPGILHNLA